MLVLNPPGSTILTCTSPPPPHQGYISLLSASENASTPYLVTQYPERPKNETRPVC